MMQGRCKVNTLLILIDNGNTHNFIKTNIALRMALPLTKIKNFIVYGGVDELPSVISCQFRCNVLLFYKFICLGHEWLGCSFGGPMVRNFGHISH